MAAIITPAAGSSLLAFGEVQMNAIVSICHFCELHGPSVVFCTQAFRDLLGFNVIADIETSPLENTRTGEDEEQTKDGKSDLWKYGRIHQDIVAQARNETPNETCVACRSFPHNKPGYISNDDSARVSYISSQYPLQTELYILVRQACIRSLSCEVCPGKEGPIYFGDEARGHVLSYTFFLRDVQARGFHRWYSIMVLMKDKMLLLNSWPFIVKHLKQIINNLQDSASKIYETEESVVNHRALRSAAVKMDNLRKQRGLNIQQSYNILGSTIFHHLVHHLLIGRQVILRGNSDVIISALIKSIQPLLPKHCYRAIHFSPHYVDCASCNVLGLHSLVSIPQNVMAMKNLCVIDLIPKGETGEVSSKATPRTSSNLLSTQEVIKGDYQDPKDVQDIKDSIKNYTIKVKVWIHVQNAKKMLHGCPERVPSPSTLQTSNRSSSIPIIQSSSHSLAHSPVMSTFRSMSPGGLGERQQEIAHQDEKHHLLAAIGSTEWDVPFLEFWAKNFCQDSSQEMILQ
ncbi:uncharacterized protein LOC135099889 isoform X6 [Scylla paramamosain]|uniref:uncharacterized protein LOC135099889 isoform X6 n=1 Tax=Scylla paramamosain TaxID=85552 RepID=UPI003082BC82